FGGAVCEPPLVSRCGGAEERFAFGREMPHAAIGAHDRPGRCGHQRSDLAQHVAPHDRPQLTFLTWPAHLISASTQSEPPTSTLTSPSTCLRPAAPSRFRSAESAASARIAATHSSVFVARKPVSPSRTKSACTPTGFATTGRPAAWY